MRGAGRTRCWTVERGRFAPAVRTLQALPLRMKSSAPSGPLACSGSSGGKPPAAQVVPTGTAESIAFSLKLWGL